MKMSVGLANSHWLYEEVLLSERKGNRSQVWINLNLFLTLPNYLIGNT